MSKERPILFSGPMVRALLNGSKTQTRRVVRGSEAWPSAADRAVVFTMNGTALAVVGRITYSPEIRCPYGMPGDRLWVRESFAHQYRDNTTPAKRSPEDVVYMADGLTPDPYAFGTWKPSIHMPRWASRITLQITSVRVERLQAISDADCIAEGIERHTDGCGWKRGPLQGDQNQVDRTAFPTLAYRSIWESINGPDSWAANPWVWAIDFRRLP